MRKAAAISAAVALLASATVGTASVLAGAHASGTKRAKLVNFKFIPKRMTITRGTKVTWSWSTGAVPHNVTKISGPGGKFHSRTTPKLTYSHTFTTKGRYHLQCTVHPTLMNETVVVR